MLLSCPLFQSTLPARGATTLQGSAASVLIFQSTLPARGATSARAFALPDYLNFNPRSPHGERPAAGAPRKQRSAISIHAPRTGSDERSRFCPAGLLEFQSTLPARGATCRWRSAETAFCYFNPRSPHGERPSATRAFGTSRFQSTLPARGATFSLQNRALFVQFQSTLPARGATPPFRD